MAYICEYIPAYAYCVCCTKTAQELLGQYKRTKVSNVNYYYRVSKNIPILSVLETNVYINFANSSLFCFVM